MRFPTGFPAFFLFQAARSSVSAQWAMATNTSQESSDRMGLVTLPGNSYPSSPGHAGP